MLNNRMMIMAAVSMMWLVGAFGVRAEMIEIGRGTIQWYMPFHTANDDSRLEVIYLASEMAEGGTIESLSLNVQSLPETMTNFTIRMKHTALSSFMESSLDGPDSGWVTVYQNDESIGSTGWVTFTFSAPFVYNGTDNLLVDFSFNNGEPSINGYVMSTYWPDPRSAFALAYSEYGDPLTWEGSADPAVYTDNLVPNVRLYFALPQDADGDGMWDAWENAHPCMMSGTPDAGLDYDGDEVVNLEEFTVHSDPCDVDTDGDGMDDGYEFAHACLDPTADDTLGDGDADGLTNHQEFIYPLDPCNPDTDGDGMADGWELAYGLDPQVDDSGLDMDGDGLTNGVEQFLGTSPATPDTDEDGMDDGYEFAHACLDPATGDTLGDGDADGLTNYQEFIYPLDPCDPDTDGGGEDDGSELASGSDPLLASDDAWTVIIGTGTIIWYMPLHAANQQTRVQTIYTASELQAPAAAIESLALDVTAVPGRVLNNFTIRLKHTALDYYLAPSLDGPDSGWVTVYKGNEAFGVTGWRTFDFGVPFFYNGTDNLMVDVSFDNSGVSENGYVRSTLTADPRTALALADGEFGDPLSWEGSADPQVYSQNQIMNVRLFIDQAWDSDGDGMSDEWENAYPCMRADTPDADDDYDGDGVTNTAEALGKSDPCSTDTDGDGMDDGYELSHGCLDPVVDDAADDGDGDGLANLQEFVYPLDPCDPDTDGDGMADGWELSYGLDPLADDSGLDPDGDGLTSGVEFLYGSDPSDPDTDGDGMDDGYENAEPCLSELIYEAQGDPDRDGLFSLPELVLGTDPCVFDTDGDGLGDGDELNNLLTDPLDPDTDHDGMDDGWEASHALDPLGNDTALDPDLDTLTNLEEYMLRTDPRDPDTDHDGMDDGWEARNHCMEPLRGNSLENWDLDAYINLQEYHNGSNPCAFEGPRGRLCIVVQAAVLSSISSSLDQYRIDLEHQGYEVIIHQVSSSVTPLEIRSALAGYYQEPESLAAAVLVGNIPAITYEIQWVDPFGNSYYENFPCDLYYMDLDGEWLDVLTNGQVQPNNGMYDTHTGNRFLEIWVSRMKADNLPVLGNETDLLNAYFDKDHRYRTGQWAPRRKAMILADDPFALFYDESYTRIAEGMYGAGNVDVVLDSDSTTPTFYKQGLMAREYEFVVPVTHGGPTGQDFQRCSGLMDCWMFVSGWEGGASSADYAAISPPWVFVLVLACNVCKFTTSNYLCGTIAFNPNDSGLLAVGSTKIGAGTGGEYSLFDPLTTNSPMGVAYQYWFNNLYADPYWNQYVESYYYGAVMIGDGALQQRMSLLDYDHDGLPNDYENAHLCLDATTTDATLDPDQDGLASADEYSNHTDPCNPDTDGDASDDGADCGPLDPAVFPGAPELCDGIDNQCPGDPHYGLVDEGCPGVDSDGDGLADIDEIAVYGTDPQNPDTDGDGLSDGQETGLGTSPVAWDTDGDYIPDGYEATHLADATPLDPLNALDGPADFEPAGSEDRNPNFHEYWNGTDPWAKDPVPDLFYPGSPGCYYWGEGDGDGYVLANDRSILLSEVLGSAQSYDNVLPRGVADDQDMDADGYILAGDLSILKSFIVESLVGGVGSRAAALEKVYEPASPVAVGGTTHVTVRVRNENVDNNLYSGGFSVVFSVDPSSTGSAILLGGDGSYGAGTRFSVSGPSGASDGGHATMHLKVTAPGTIIINASIPACGTSGIGRWVDEIMLAPSFSITAGPP